MKLFIASLSNGIDPSCPYTVVAKNLAGARRVAESNRWATVKGVKEAFLSEDDAGNVCVNQHALLIGMPNANRNRNPISCTGFGYTHDEIVRLVGLSR